MRKQIAAAIILILLFICQVPAALAAGSGNVKAWGWNGYGQLGDGTTTPSTTPVDVSGLTEVMAVAGGYSHTVALKSDGTVWAWGNNSNGSSPVQVTDPADPTSFLTDVIAITCGAYHTVALKSDGTVWAWGANWSGQLGDGTTSNSSTPVQVRDPDDETGYLNEVSSIASGSGHTAAMKSDGTVWTWGSNHYGQLGDGTTTDRLTPVQVMHPADLTGYLTGVFSIAGGGTHTVALKSDGTVWAWGYNNAGQLGDGTTTDKHKPVQVKAPSGTGFLKDVTAIACGGYFTLALKSAGTAWAWGYNADGELGDGTMTDRLKPVQVSGLTDARIITGGEDHAIAVKSDGTAWAWGNNQIGQLGDGTTSNSSTPVQVSGLTGVFKIAAGYYHTVAIYELDAPSSTITAPADGDWINVTTFTVTGTADDGDGSGVEKVEVSTDGGTTWNLATGTTSWTYSWTLPADGTYSIQSRATDNAGNTETPGSGISVSVDITAPSSSITAPSDGASLSKGTYDITGIADDGSGSGSGVEKVEVSTDGGATWNLATGTTNWSYSFTISAVGIYNIRSRATDNFGNVETPGAGITVSVDGMDLSFIQTGRRVALKAICFNNGVPVARKAIKFYKSTYDITSSTWSAWTLAGTATSRATGIAIKVMSMSDGLYRFKAAYEPAGAVLIESVPTDDCPIAAVSVIAPPTNTVTTDNTPAVSWEAYPGATGYVILIWNRSSSSVVSGPGDVTTADLPELRKGVKTFWHVVAALPNGYSIPSTTRVIIYREGTALSDLNTDTSGTAIRPSVTLTGDDSGALSNKKVYFYYKSVSSASWLSAGYGITDAGGLAQPAAAKTLTAGDYDLKAVFKGDAGLYPSADALGTFSLP